MDILLPISRWLNTASIYNKMCKWPTKQMQGEDRIYQEFMDSDKALEIVENLPKKDGKRPIPVFVVYGLDKTPLSTTGK